VPVDVAGDCYGAVPEQVGHRARLSIGLGQRP
jgi:hypothetical protein